MLLHVPEIQDQQQGNHPAEDPGNQCCPVGQLNKLFLIHFNFHTRYINYSLSF